MTIRNTDRALAEHLLAERRETIGRAEADHQAGWHVGTDPDVTLCADCHMYGDMPRHYSQTDPPTAEQLVVFRIALLNRNVAEAAAKMHLHADLMSVERELMDGRPFA